MNTHSHATSLFAFSATFNFQLIEFLGDPDLKKVLSSQVGIDWFRKHLVIEFSEEGLDLWKATHDMLAQDYTSTAGGGDESGANTALERETGVTPQAAATVEGERKGGEDAGAGEVGGSDIRKTGRDIYERFIKSGCGAECNLPGTVVRKVLSENAAWTNNSGEALLLNPSCYVCFFFPAPFMSRSTRTLRWKKNPIGA